MSDFLEISSLVEPIASVRAVAIMKWSLTGEAAGTDNYSVTQIAKRDQRSFSAPLEAGQADFSIQAGDG